MLVGDIKELAVILNEVVVVMEKKKFFEKMYISMLLNLFKKKHYMKFVDVVT